MYKCVFLFFCFGGCVLFIFDGRCFIYLIMEWVEDGNFGVEEGDERIGVIDMNEERLEEVVVWVGVGVVERCVWREKKKEIGGK